MPPDTYQKPAGPQMRVPASVDEHLFENLS